MAATVTSSGTTFGNVFVDGVLALTADGDGWIRRPNGEKLGRGVLAHAVVLATNAKHSEGAVAARQSELRGRGVK